MSLLRLNEAQLATELDPHQVYAFNHTLNWEH